MTTKVQLNMIDSPFPATHVEYIDLPQSDVQLTAASPQRQIVLGMSPNISMLLPDATSFTGPVDRRFVVSNPSLSRFRIKDSEGLILKSMSSVTEYECSLVHTTDNTGWCPQEVVAWSDAYTSVNAPSGTYVTGHILSASTVVILYRNGSNNAAIAAGTISGNTVTWGAELELSSGTGRYPYRIVRTSDTSFFVFTTNAFNGGTGTVQYCSVSGTTVTDSLPAVVDVLGSTRDLVSVNLPGTEKILFATGTASYVNQVQVIAPNGTSEPTIGSAAQLNTGSATIAEAPRLLPISSTDFVAVYSRGAITGVAIGARICSVSGTTISLGSETLSSVLTGATAGGILPVDDGYVYFGTSTTSHWYFTNVAGVVTTQYESSTYGIATTVAGPSWGGQVMPFQLNQQAFKRGENRFYFFGGSGSVFYSLIDTQQQTIAAVTGTPRQLTGGTSTADSIGSHLIDANTVLCPVHTASHTATGTINVVKVRFRI